MLEILPLLLMFLGILLFFFIIGYPVGFGLILTTILLMILGVGTGVNTSLLASRMFRSLSSFTMLAIPFFLLSGRIMNAGGMTKRIFRFASAIVGDLTGGLCYVNVIASMIFSGMSGLAVADAAGLGAIEYESMIKAGYPKRFSVGITAASTTIGPIIPPSVPLVVFAVLADVSVGGILVGGLLPGITIGISLMIMIAIIAKIRNYPCGKKRDFKEFIDSFSGGVLSLGTPALLLAGIISGAFTVTEAAAIAALYALILTIFIYKELSFKELLAIIKQTMIDTAVVLFLVSAAAGYGFLLIRTRLPIILAENLLSLTQNPIIILIILNIFLLIIGSFLETIAALTILVPVVVPMIEMAGINPMHFGVVMVFNLMIGLLTPPFGNVLFVLNKAIGLEIDEIFKGVLPFYIPLIVALLIITLFPQIVLWLPETFYF